MTPPLAGIRIIVVEDHDDTRDLLEQSFRLLGATVSAVASARDAVAQVSTADIILTDLALAGAGEDGVWLSKQVKLQPRPVPVIALSGYTAEQYPRIEDAPFARTLLKPVDPEEVAKVIWEVLHGEPTDEPPCSAA